MNILKKMTRCFLKKNPRRTAVTIVGIILSTALITAVANLAASLRCSIIKYYCDTRGDYHYAFEGVAPENLKYFENNQSFEKVGISYEIGYALFQESRNEDKPYLFIRGMDAQAMDCASITLRDGRLPEKEGELVLSLHARTNGGMTFAVGDTITLQMGVRTAGGYGLYQENPYNEEESFQVREERSFTIVGICERPAFLLEPYPAPGYTGFTVADASAPADRIMVFAKCTQGALKDSEKVLAGLKGLVESVSANESLLRWETMNFTDIDLMILYGMAAIAVGIIILTSVFCIRNSFVISLTEKLRLYGMVASVGATKRQRRKLVHYEAFYLGCIGIPLGIAGGVLATFVLTKATSGLLSQALNMLQLNYAFSLPAIAAGAVLAAVTIYLSAAQSAGKAAKISPILAIRSNDASEMKDSRHFKRERKALHVPSLIGKLFGMGGTIAYKNLKRSRVKYRATVVSIVVSVAIFIAMTTFVQLGMQAAGNTYGDMEYSLLLRLRQNPGESRMEEAMKAASQEGVEAYCINRAQTFLVPMEEIPYTEEFLADPVVGIIPFDEWADDGSEQPDEERKSYVLIYSLGDAAYAEYCKEVGISVEEAQKGAIVEGEYQYSVIDEHGEKRYSGRIAEFEKGQVLSGVRGSDRAPIELTVVAQTDRKPRFLKGKEDNYLVCYVSDAWMDKWCDNKNENSIIVYMKCTDAGAVEDAIRSDEEQYDYYLVNYEAQMREQRSMYLLFAIFFYGFIAVIALIGVTNIFNTITTNMELRSREFAMLRSVGMTGREFKRMINLESVFYGARALCMGIPLGCTGSFLFYRVMGIGYNMSFQIPWGGIGISIAAVAVLLFVIMRYSMGRINRRNLIETIRNENI